MAYYWVTESQKYIQSLGFGTGRFRPVNMEPQRLRINQWGLDNSFATTHKDEIRLGKGGVDDAEDGQVITHEYGHAIHFSQNFSFASARGGRDQRGFRRLLERHDHGGRPAEARASGAERSSLRRRLGRHFVRSDTATLPAARRLGLALPRGSGRRGACGRSDLVAGALGHPERDRQRARPTPPSSRASSTSRVRR